MVNALRSATPVAPIDFPVEPMLTELPQSHGFDCFSQTVLKLESPALLQLTQTGRPIEQAQKVINSQTTSTMQRLVEVVAQLRSSESGWRPDLAMTPEALVPYVAEEAYDVLDALQQENLETENYRPETQPDAKSGASFITIKALIPRLLWFVARGSYPVMQLIEGVQAQQQLPDATNSTGMLRLAILLEITTPNTQQIFDLATHSSPEHLLDEDATIHLLSTGFFSQSIATSTDAQRQQTVQVKQQLQELTRQIQQATPTIAPVLQGIQTDLLPPGGDWCAGEIRLRLQLEFVPHSTNSAYEERSLTDLVEAELLEEGDAPLQSVRPSNLHVAITELPRKPFHTATLVRLVDPTLELQRQLTLQQQLSDACQRLDVSKQIGNDEQQQLDIVQEACALVDRGLGDGNGDRLQPRLLLDEVMPELMWTLTSSSYEVMQLIGGLQMQVLQPTTMWETGTLRLLPKLSVRHDAEQWQFDLATGQSLSSSNDLDPHAIIQSCDRSMEYELIQADQLSRSLLAQIQKTTPEIKQWMSGVQIEWLAESQEWQAGSLQLSLNLEWLADAD